MTKEQVMTEAWLCNYGYGNYVHMSHKLGLLPNTADVYAEHCLLRDKEYNRMLSNDNKE